MLSFNRLEVINKKNKSEVIKNNLHLPLPYSFLLNARSDLDIKSGDI